ncbi:hypothetical protein DY000_02023717 [Brassica cretica]|uniref:Uncharacterized protein n=1 Tax=Brassica cretica TaxID=69181 RepID=A0ABQ7EJW3_BRACR|nr:hypothetical protein DY000_02023717 [Brassica cretica]
MLICATHQLVVSKTADCNTSNGEMSLLLKTFSFRAFHRNQRIQGIRALHSSVLWRLKFLCQSTHLIISSFDGVHSGFRMNPAVAIYPESFTNPQATYQWDIFWDRQSFQQIQVPILGVAIDELMDE